MKVYLKVKGKKNCSYVLNEKMWQEILLEQEVNVKFNAFMDTLLYYFDTVHPFNTII
jgi:hypothetical protein